jgi:hypothetical protein
MEKHNIEICGLAETNTDWEYKSTKDELTNKAKNIFRNSALNFSNNQFRSEHKTSYQPGGCIHICTNHWTGTIIQKIDDDRNMGRWTGQKYRLKGDRYLTIITAYRPCRYSSSHFQKATQTVHSQQATMLKDQGLEEPDPRKIFIDDMIKLVKEQEQDPMNSCILMLDANKAIEDKEGSMRKIFNNTNLVDIFSNHTRQKCTIPHTLVGQSELISY